MKLKIKHIFKAISICTMMCFSVLFVVFSSVGAALNSPSLEKIGNKNQPIVKQYSNNNENLILQNANEDSTWSNKLKQDLNDFSNKDKEVLKQNLNYHSHNQHGTSHTLKFCISGKIGWGANGRFSGSRSGTTFLDGIEITIFPSSGNEIITEHNVYESYGGRQWGWTGWHGSKDWSRNLYVNIPSGYSINDIVNRFSIRLKTHYSGDDEYHWIRLKEINIYNGSSIIYSSSDLWDLGNLGANSKTTSYSKAHSYSFEAIYIGQTDYINVKKISAKKIFMSVCDIRNKNFTQKELKSLIKLYDDNKEISTSNIEFGNLILNRQKKQLEIKISKISDFDSNHYYEKGNLIIPVHTVDFNYFLEGSIKSDSYWKHKSDGSTEYHTKKPKTKIRLSESYLKALYIFTDKNKILEKLNKDAWGFVSSDKEIAISKIKSYALNISNYDKVKQAYVNSHDINVINNLKEIHELDKYKEIFIDKDIKDFLYVIKNSDIRIKYGIKEFKQKQFHVKDALNGVFLKISDEELRVLDQNRINWSMHVKDFKIITKNINSSLDNNLKIDLPNDHFQNYDLHLKYKTSSQYELVHSYLFQAQGLDISENISFIMEDGTILDQNFKVIRPSRESDIKINDFGYIAIRYWTTFKNGQKEYLTLINKSDKWYSPKYNKFISQIDSTFDNSKLEYLFNKNLQMIINPYQKTQGKRITPKTKQKFGIKRVIDEVNGNKKILEDWDDGRWSHTHNEKGLSNFDGIFGSDMNGILDSSGRLSMGRNHIDIEIQNSSLTGIKNSFFITIDKNPVSVQTTGIKSSLKKLDIITDEGLNKRLYFSNGPINLKVEDIDIKTIKAEFIDHLGHWYKIPIEIKSKQVDGKWKQVINTTIDYAGFAKIDIFDQAGNKKQLYFWLKQKNDENPDFLFDHDLLFSDANILFNGKKINIFDSNPEIIFSSPLIKEVRITKLNYENQQWINSKPLDGFEINEYFPKNSKKYKFAKPIDSQQSVLKYAGDELSHYLSRSSNKDWLVTNKILKFNKTGLFKIDLKTKFTENELITKYIYIKDNNLKFIDLKDSQEDKANFNHLPDSNEGPKDDLDSIHKMLKKININIPGFLIKDYYIEFSLPWYSKFTKIKKKQTCFEKEGKYKIHIIDIFGNKRDFQILLIKKNISEEQRTKINLEPIYGEYKKGQNKEKYAFWKGKVIWNYFRYEDEDHAKWEHDIFIKKAMKSGLSRKQAELLYKKLKSNPNWDLKEKDKDGKPFDFASMLKKFSTPSASYLKSKNLSKGQMIGLIVGSVFGGTLLIGLSSWFIFKRFKTRAIK